jgi:hypothetical protein
MPLMIKMAIDKKVKSVITRQRTLVREHMQSLVDGWPDSFRDAVQGVGC